jgi:hypothetical protein
VVGEVLGLVRYQIVGDYLGKSGRASGRGVLRVSTNESIVLVVVVPFLVEDHAVS